MELENTLWPTRPSPKPQSSGSSTPLAGTTGGVGGAQTRGRASEDELIDFLAERVAKWWLPDKVLLVEQIPKTGTGKFDKKVVRDQFSNLLEDQAD